MCMGADFHRSTSEAAVCMGEDFPQSTLRLLSMGEISHRSTLRLLCAWVRFPTDTP